MAEELEDTRTIEEQLADEYRLADELGAYRGRWVAVRLSKVVASADTLAALREQDLDNVDGIFQVSESDHFFLAAV